MVTFCSEIATGIFLGGKLGGSGENMAAYLPCLFTLGGPAERAGVDPWVGSAYVMIRAPAGSHPPEHYLEVEMFWLGYVLWVATAMWIALLIWKDD